MSRWLRFRSSLDPAVAALLGLALMPVIMAGAAAVWLEDRKFPIIGLRRVGQHGRLFRMWKLRSMTPAGTPGGAPGSPLTTVGDERVTRVGRHLRRWRLDELPQLWNVVCGEMILLGPRPETPEYVDLADERWQRVLWSPPGIAGPTQLLVHVWENVALHGDADDVYRNEILPVKLALDGWYVRAASPSLDFAVGADIVTSFVLPAAPRRVRRRAQAAVPAVSMIPRIR